MTSLRVLCLAAALFAVGCSDDDVAAPHEPWLWVRADRHDEIAARLSREPYASILGVIEAEADNPFREPEAGRWDHQSIGHNNHVAQANAVLAWLFADEERARKAVDLLSRMPTDFENNDTWDVNIRMPHVLMTYAYAWDLLRAGPFMTAAEADDAKARVLAVTEAFFADYVDNGLTRQAVIGFAQNNHPIRTAAAIGLVALLFPDDPRTAAWADWAVSELSYLMGPDGQYIQPDGGVSEGPFYYGFAFGPAIAFFIAMDNAADPARVFHRDCRNRQNVEPWAGHGCVDGEPFVFDNPLRGELLEASVDWSISLRLPIGWRPPLADGNFIHPPGGALLSHFGAAPHLMWDFENRPEALDKALTWGMALAAHHLAYLDDAQIAEEPPYLNRFLPAAGNAVFRSGWDEDARWLLLVAEHGAARKTLHDHVDGTSFSVAAYGEYLLLDPGYYKPNELDNAITSGPQSHNVILVDGEGAPKKGLLFEFGDTDAFLENPLDGETLAYAEAHQRYRDTDFERSVIFARQRYFVVADRLASDATAPREHAFRVGGWAGYDVPGLFEIAGTRAHWEREKAGIFVYLGATDPGLAWVEPAREPLTAPHVGAFDEQRNVRDHGVADGVVTAIEPGFLAVLAPYRVGGSGDEAPLTVTAIDAGSDAVAWLIEGDGGRELAWLRKPGAATTITVGAQAVATDGEIALVSLDGAFGLVARGTQLSLDGAPVVTGADATKVKATP
jgi:hypothetical protein